VGHLSLGYLLSKICSKTLKTDLDIPLILMLSVIPDVDILIPFLQHKGPTHSIIVALIIFTPILIAHRRKAIPYLIALSQHPLIGDGAVQLLWPITCEKFGVGLNIKSQMNTYLEYTLFTLAFTTMLKTGDLKTLLKPHKSNITLTIPTFALIMPVFFKFPIEPPTTLIPAHLIYTAILLPPVIIDYIENLKKLPHRI